MTDFHGKVALVVGATSGIGRATALAFAREGATVVVSGRRHEEGEATVAAIASEGGRAAYIPMDVRDEEQVAALVDGALERFGRIDCAYNNAGAESFGTIAEMDVGGFDDVVATVLRGTALCLSHEMRAMAASGGGAIVNSSSQAGATYGVPTNAPDTGAKAGVVGLTRTAALEGGPSGIRVNCVAPAHIASDMGRAAWASFGIPEERIADLTCVGRVGVPEDVAATVLFLCSAASGFTTGATIPVDGGWSVKPNL